MREALPYGRKYIALVEWLRHRPFTAGAWVQFPYALPDRSVTSRCGGFCVFFLSAFASFLHSIGICGFLPCGLFILSTRRAVQVRSRASFICNTDVMAAYQPSKLIVRVRVPCVAPEAGSHPCYVGGYRLTPQKMTMLAENCRR